MQKLENQIQEYVKEKVQESDEKEKLLFPIRRSALPVGADPKQVIHMTRSALAQNGYHLEESNKCATGSIKFVASKKAQ